MTKIVRNLIFVHKEKIQMCSVKEKLSNVVDEKS